MSWWDTNLLDPVHELHCVWVIEFLQLGQFWQDPWKILEQWRGREQQFIIENGSQHHVHNVTFSLLHVSGIGPISNYIHFIMCMLKVLKVFYYCERFYEYILCRVHFRGIKKKREQILLEACVFCSPLSTGWSQWWWEQLCSESKPADGQESPVQPKQNETIKIKAV